MRAGTPALLMMCGRVAARAADSETFVPLLLSHARVFGSEVDGSTTLDERQASSNHVVALAARRGRTAWTGEVQKRGSDTYRPEWSDPANLGLDPAQSRPRPPHVSKGSDTCVPFLLGHVRVFARK